MTIERKREIINASGVVDLPRGNFFLLLSATAAVETRLHRDGHSEVFAGIVGGLYVRRITPWLSLQMTAAAGTIVEYFVGTEVNTEDETDIRLAVSAIAGSVATRESPTDSVVGTRYIIGAASNPSIATNANRRRMRVTADATNPGSVYVADSAGVVPHDELQPGVSKQYDTLGVLWLFHLDAVADHTVYVLEEE